ncbi:hypothetical protein ANCDUO_00561 [Ancylostoma duodenale]|uniref:Tyrosinase copper-binding domain-containing protein n=1 Tax=Ancylostoma duodenale TaxID=51022 RepID=A0A0C2E179_9BILA|nr:hypothetical protein ANCDUO_00561 [Ancylostoma duodenale]
MVEGDMENFLTASNDPLFWSLHAMIDLIWQRWRNLYQTTVCDRESQYPANDTTCSGPAHFRDSPMVPFNNFRIIDGFSNNYTRRCDHSMASTSTANVEQDTANAMKENATTFASISPYLPVRLSNESILMSPPPIRSPLSELEESIQEVSLDVSKLCNAPTS